MSGIPFSTALPPPLIDYLAIVTHTRCVDEEGTAVSNTPGWSSRADSFPPPRIDDQDFMRTLPQFCVPYGVDVVDCLKFHAFVLTDCVGIRRYGHCLTIPASDSPIHLVLLSRWGKYANTLKRILVNLYKEGLSISIERYVVMLCYEVPVPPPNTNQCVAFSIGKTQLALTSADKMAIPTDEHDLWPLFTALSTRNIVHVFAAALLEQTIIVHSRIPALLTPVMDGLLSLLLPFVWSLVYIPVLPNSLLDCIEAPTQYILGGRTDEVRAKIAEGIAQNPDPTAFTDVLVVDLDSDLVSFGNPSRNGRRHLPDLPANHTRRLLGALSSILRRDLDSFDEIESSPDTHTPTAQIVADETPRIRECFFSCLALIVGSYRHFYIKKATDYVLGDDTLPLLLSELFNLEAFVASKQEEDHPFWEQFSLTMTFNLFVIERQPMPWRAPDLFDRRIELMLAEGNVVDFPTRETIDTFHRVVMINNQLLVDSTAGKAKQLVTPPSPRMDENGASTFVVNPPDVDGMERAAEGFQRSLDKDFLQRSLCAIGAAQPSAVNAPPSEAEACTVEVPDGGNGSAGVVDGNVDVRDSITDGCPYCKEECSDYQIHKVTCESRQQHFERITADGSGNLISRITQADSAMFFEDVDELVVGPYTSLYNALTTQASDSQPVLQLMRAVVLAQFAMDGGDTSENGVLLGTRRHALLIAVKMVCELFAREDSLRTPGEEAMVQTVADGDFAVFLLYLLSDKDRTTIAEETLSSSPISALFRKSFDDAELDVPIPTNKSITELQRTRSIGSPRSRPRLRTDERGRYLTPTANEMYSATPVIVANAPGSQVLNDFLMSESSDGKEAIVGAAACDLSTTLLEEIVGLFKGVSRPDDDMTSLLVDDPGVIDTIKRSPLYRTFCMAASALARVEAVSLSHNEKCCFFVNVYNALSLHACVAFGPPRGSLRVSGRLSWGKASYNIGGHLYSILEIEHAVLRNASSVPHVYGVWFSAVNTLKFDPRDERYLTALTARFAFIDCVLNHATTSSPQMPILSIHELNEQLYQAFLKFLEDTVELDIGKRRVTLPCVMQWYMQDYGTSRLEVLLYLVNMCPLWSVSDWVIQQKNSKKLNSINVKFKGYDWGFRYMFKNDIFCAPSPPPPRSLVRRFSIQPVSSS